MRKLLLIVICLCTLTSITLPKSSNSLKNRKHVIGAQPGHGFFAAFFCALNHLGWCEKNHKIPLVYWNSNCLYYEPHGYNNSTNAWEYYFEQISNLKYSTKDKINLDYFVRNSRIMPINWTGHDTGFNYRLWANNLIKKYIRIKKNIQNKIDDFYEKNIKGKPTIGIHIRGTDKHNEVVQLPIDAFADAANKYKGYQFLIATDEESLLQELKAKLKGPVIAYDAYRSLDGKPIHYARNISKGKLGEDVLIEAKLLSMCNLYIHTRSNVSSAVLCFNPDLKHILLYSPAHYEFNQQ